MSAGLKEKTMKGLSWNLADNAMNQGIRFLVGLVLARLLTPSDFGMIGIALIFVTIFEDIVDGGFTNALIQKKSPTQADYSTAFVTNLAFSVFLYVILFWGAPYIANFFNNPLLSLLTRVISAILVIDAFMFVPKAKLTKELDFKTQTKISVISSFVSGITGIGCALCGYGVWSLVVQQLVRHFLNTFLLWLANKGTISMQFSRQSFISLFSFGSKVLISDLISSIYKQLYHIVIGKVYAPATLGQYTRAHQFGSLFSQTFTKIVQKVSYPVLSNIQDENERLLSAYKNLIGYSMFISFTCMLLLAAIAHSLIIVLIGEKWLMAVGFLQILCFTMMLYPLHAINQNILKVKGRSDLYLKLVVITKIVGLAPVLLGIFCNIYYMLIGSFVESCICYCLNSRYSGLLVGYGTTMQIKDVFPSLMVALISASIVFSISFLSLPPYIILFLQIVIGLCLIVGISEITRLDAYLGVKSLAKSYFGYHE